MTNEQQWADRVRAWRASGKSKADFCRNATYTASGLGYWVKRLEPASTQDSPNVPRVQLARVVRSATPSAASAPAQPATRPLNDRARSASDAAIVIEVMAVRAMVPRDVTGSELDSMLASIVRGWTGGRT